MTRTDNVKKNLFFNTIKFVTQLLLQFVSRTVLIYLMGAEYLGLNGLFSNIFSFCKEKYIIFARSFYFNFSKNEKSYFYIIYCIVLR